MPQRLYPCPACSNRVALSAISCPKCGCQLEFKEIHEPTKTFWLTKYLPAPLRALSYELQMLILIAALVVPVWIVTAVLLPKSGRPINTAESIEKSQNLQIEKDFPGIGNKPNGNIYGGYMPVRQYLRQTLNDYDSSEFVQWSEVEPYKRGGESCWVVDLKLRAKNAYGGKILKNERFYIKNDAVFFMEDLDK